MATGGIIDNMQQLVDTGKQLNDLSTTTGVAAQNFGVLATGLQGSGLSADTTNSLFTDLQKTMTENSAQAVDTRIAWRDLGIDIDTVGKNGNDVQAVFLAGAAVLSQYQDGAEKTALAQKLFGASTSEVINGLDAANAAFARIDPQVRANIASLASYTAETQKYIAVQKDLRDNEPANVLQSQISSSIGEMGGGWQKFTAGLNGGSGLFSDIGRNMMSAGASDIASGFTAISAVIDSQITQMDMRVAQGIDKVFGTDLAARIQQHLDAVNQELLANLPGPTNLICGRCPQLRSKVLMDGPDLPE